MGLTLQQKQALTGRQAPRYRQSDKKTKSKILDEFVQATGYNRKYALHLLTRWGKDTFLTVDGKPVKFKAGTAKRRPGGGRKPVYGPEVIESLKRIRALKADRDKLAVRGLSGAKPGKLLKKHIPVRTYYPWNERKPGFFEIDTVHHCGERDSGEFCLALDATDVASGWVELRPLLNKAQKWVLEALPDIQSGLPFPLLGIDSDNGSEFINHTLTSWCDTRRITFTRIRPYHKNDNCFVEQKNLTCVRNYVGYRRFDTPSEHQALAAVYHALCPLLNYFLPTIKLIDKQRAGSNVRKVYDKPMSPFQRLMGSPDLPAEVKAELTRRCQTYNPVLLQQGVHRTVDTLMELNRQKALMRRQSLADAVLENFWLRLEFLF